IQENIPWCMIFADDIVLIAESAKRLNNKLESWRKTLEDNGLRVSKEKLEYLRCDFGRYEVVHQEMDIRIRDQILQPKESFTYLSSVLHRSGRIVDDMAHRLRADLEKAYDSVPRELVWKTLLDKGTPRRYSRVIKDMYEGAKTRVRTTAGNTEYFPVKLGLHQGSAISLYLFTLILDELSRGIQKNIPWCMIFAD
nr:hypothetical protein [Tanacetum cinerariifolium]